MEITSDIWLFLTVALASCKLTAHICLWTVSSQNNEDTATKAMQVQNNACSLIKLMLSYDCKSEDVESNRNIALGMNPN